MVAEDIILAPVVTEKSTMDMQDGKYTFKVAKKATKVEIKNAVEKLFEVKVLKFNTMIVKGKEKRVGVHQGRTSDWKKAIVFNYNKLRLASLTFIKNLNHVLMYTH